MFYGWYIVAAGLLLSAYNDFALCYGFTAFMAPIATTFGWSYAQISLAISIRGIQTGALSPLIGMVVDRWPARRLVFIGVIIYGLGLLCISQATNLAMFYAGFLIVGLGSSLAVFMVTQATLAKWFKRNIGKASGILAMGCGIGGASLPLLVKMIDTQGWQTSLAFLAVGIWVIGIPLSFVYRTRPEDYGLLPDGKPQDDVKGPSSAEDYDFSSGVKQALKMRAFWHLSIASTFQMVAFSAKDLHIMPYLASLGVDRSTAGVVAMLVPLVSLAARIPFGFLADIFVKRYLMAFSMGLLGIGLFLLWLIDGSSFGLMVLFAIFFGLGVGGLVPLRLPIMREYFGTKRYATISGLMGVFSMIGGVAGAPVAGWVFDTLGIYDPVWLIFAGLTTIGTISLLTMPPAARRPKSIIS
ncbi:L-lactate transporter [subsurface metagenome]